MLASEDAHSTQSHEAMLVSEWGVERIVATQRAESNARNTKFRNFKVSLNEPFFLVVAQYLVGHAMRSYYISGIICGGPVTANHTQSGKGGQQVDRMGEMGYNVGVDGELW